MRKTIQVNTARDVLKFVNFQVDFFFSFWLLCQTDFNYAEHYFSVFIVFPLPFPLPECHGLPLSHTCCVIQQLLM